MNAIKIFLLYLIAIINVSCSSQNTNELTVELFNDKLKSVEQVIIIDVRTIEQFDEGHIKNAINIDYSSDNFKETINNLDTTKTYLLYCRSGRRSAAAIKLMNEAGFKQLYCLKGGITAWKEACMPTIKIENNKD